MALIRGIPLLSFEARAFQEFVLGLKLLWTTDLYAVVAKEAAAARKSSASELEAALESSEAYRLFSWLERHLQQFKYLGRWGILHEIRQESDALSRLLVEAATTRPELLTLHPEIQLPDYYVATDFHQHPGGIWSDDHDAFAYEIGTGTTMPVIDREDFHTRYAREVADRFHPASILDAGCAFGKTTLAMKRENEEADVIGFDISAPCLKLGHLRANEAGLDVSFVQTLAEDLVLDDATIDVVTGAMLLHELPPPTLRAALREANRVLRPGGHVAYLDFYAVPGAAVGEFFHLGHSRRNNEPFMETLLEMDLEAELIEAGFTNVEIGPFEETGGALTSGDGLPGAWRFPWTLIVAQKPREVV